MAVTLYPGIRRLHLLYTTRYDSIRTNDVRDDLLGIKVWISTIQGFNPEALTPIEFGVGSSINLDDLAIDTTYYVRYAFISKIQPDVFTISPEMAETTYDELTTVYGELTNDPHYLARSQTSQDPDWQYATGIFRVWSINEEVTGNGPVYSIVSGSATNGLQVTINATTGLFQATGWTGAATTAKVTFKAVYNDKEVLRDWNIINGIGQDAPQIRLITTPDEFIYNDVNAELSETPQVKVTAVLTNLTGTCTFTATGYKVDGTLIGNVAFTQTGNEIVITKNQFANAGAAAAISKQIKYVIVRAEIGDVFDEDTIIRLNNGTNEITIDLDNPNAQLQADDIGIVDPSEYAEATCSIEVYEGTTKLTPTSNASLPTPGTWCIPTIDNTNITVGTASINPGTKIISFGAPAAMTADTANIVFTVTYKSLAGVVNTRTVRQNISKIKQGVPGATAPQLNLRAPRLAFVRPKNQPESATIPDSISIIAGTVNLTNETYTFKLGNTVVQAESTNNTYIVNKFTDSVSKTYKVIVEGLNSELETVTLEDEITLYYLQEGTDIIAADINNSSRVITCDSDGTADNANFPLTFNTIVVRGTEILSSPSVTYAIENIVGLNPTKISLNSSTGIVTITQHDPTDIFSSFDIRFIVGSTNIVKTVKLTKVLDGASAPLVNLTTTNQVFIKQRNSNSYNVNSVQLSVSAVNIPETRVYEWYIDGVLQTGESGSTLTVAAFQTGTSKVIKAVVKNTTENIESFDSLTLFSVDEGSDTYIAFLTNENQTLPANQAGVLYDTTSPYATSTMTVLRGGTVLTSGVTFSVAEESATMDVSINSTTGAITVNTFTAEYNAEATFRATVTKPDGSTITLDKKLTINKTRDGTQGINSAIIYAYKRSAAALPANDSPGEVTYSFISKTITTQSLSGGWQKTIPTGNNPLYVVAATAASKEDTDVIGSAEWSAPVVLTQNGVNAATIFLYARNDSTTIAPTFSPAAEITYTFSSKSISPAVSGWSTTIPAASNGTSIWVVFATASATGTTDIIESSDWSTPQVLAQKGDKGTDGTSIDVQYSVDNATWTYNPAGAKYIRTGTKVPPATTFTYGAGVKFVPELGVEYTVVNGQTSYLHIKYSNDGGSTFTANNGEDVGTWIGTYVDFTQADSTSTSTYTWVKIKGEDGTSIDVQYSIDNVSWTYNPSGAKYIRTGTKVAGASSFTYTAGVKFVPELGVEYTVVNGQTSYLHIKYSNDGGASFTGNSGENIGDWIGTYVDFTQADSTNVNSYTWVKIKGEPGLDGSSVIVEYSTNNVNWTSNPSGAKYIRTGTKTPPATTYTYTAGVKFVPELGVEYTVVNGQTSYFHVKYSNDGGASFTGNNGEDAGTWIGTYVDFTAADSNSVSSYTWVKIKGDQGQTGQSNHRVYKVEAFGTSPATPSSTTSGGTPSGWSASPLTLSSNQVQWQSDGTTPAGSTTTTWSTPYQSYLKVAQLSAISADIGTITAGEITSGSSSDGVTVTPNGIKVTQGGVVRVRIGNLSSW